MSICTRIEPLEDRIAPAITTSFVPSIDGGFDLRVEGDGENDIITISTAPDGTYQHNFPTGAGTFASNTDFDAATPGTQSFRASEVDDFRISAGDGTDNVDISGVTEPTLDGKAILVDGGDGNDTIKGSQLGDVLFGGDGNDTIDGNGAGVDNGVGAENEPDFQGDILDGAGDDDNIKAGTGTSIVRGGGGKDILDMSSDTRNLRMKFDSTQGGGTIEDIQIKIGGKGVIEFEDIEDVRLGAGNDKVTAKNNEALALFVNLGNGTNSFTGTGTGAFDVTGGNGKDSVKVTSTGDVKTDVKDGGDVIDIVGRKVDAEMGGGADMAKLKGDEINATDNAIAKFLRVLFGTASLREQLVDSNGTDALSLAIAAAGQGIELGDTNDPGSAVIADLLLKGKAIEDIKTIIGSEDNTLDLQGRNIEVEDSGGTNKLKVSATGNVSATMGNMTNFITITRAATTMLTGGTGSDTIKGASNGANTILGNGGTDSLTGGKLGDTLSTGATSLNSTVKAGDGPDILNIDGIGAKYFGGGGADSATISGNNSIGDLGTGNDFADVLSGAHTVMGGADDDELLSQSASADPNATVKFLGGLGDDLLSSTSALVHELFGDGGNDRIFGGRAGDTLNGGAGNDEHDGGPGNDTVDGGGGKFDSMNYDHSHTSDPFTVSINGTQATTDSTDPLNPGTDLINRIFSFIFTGNGAANVVNAAAAVFETFLDGGDGADTITGGTKSNQLRGGDGSDTLIGGSGKSIINENIPFSAPPVVTLTDTTFNGLGSDTLTNIVGASFNGLGGDRTLDFSGFTRGGVTYNGGGGKETIMGTAQNDTLRGGSDDDLFMPNGGTDDIDGGGGTNTLVHDFTGATSGTNVSITDDGGTFTISRNAGGQNKSEKSTFKGIQVHEGTARNDVFKVKLVNGAFIVDVDAREGDDRVEMSGPNALASFVATMGDGADTFKASTVAGQVFGGIGDDTFDVKKSKNPNSLDGGADNDTFFTKNASSDNVTGGTGDDTATGDPGDTFLEVENVTQ